MTKALSPPKNHLKRGKILGRGTASGKGKTCARGHKGAKSRAGSSRRMGFEGGQMALIRRLPKIGFTNAPHKKQIKELTLALIGRSFEEGETVSLETLRKKKILSKNHRYAKILGGGEISKKVNIDKTISVTGGAKKSILANGGSVH